jgi:hypothetical protein
MFSIDRSNFVSRTVVGGLIVMSLATASAAVSIYLQGLTDEANVSVAAFLSAPPAAPGDSPGSITANSGDPGAKTHVVESYGRLPLHFEPAFGDEVSPEARFTARGNGYSFFLSPAGAELVLDPQSAATSEREERSGGPHAGDPTKLPDDAKEHPEGPGTRTSPSFIGMHLAGANALAVSTGLQQLEGKSNYFIGNDQNNWRTDVPNYGRVRFDEVYRGINVEYYGNQRQLEYDFIVEPGGDPGQIKLNFDGVKRVSVDEDGDLLLEAASGERIAQKKPLIYQIVEGTRVEVEGEYIFPSRRGAKAAGFKIGTYDKSKPLVIDPIVLVYSTYLGGRFDDAASGIAVDNQGNAYIVGTTEGGVYFPTTQGAYLTDLPLNAGHFSPNGCVFITKFNSQGSGLLYSTYLCSVSPSAWSHSGNGIAVDRDGNAYVTGETNAPDFPTTPGAFQRSPGGIGPCGSGVANCGDAFVAKLNPSGNALVYSTYLGGSSGDQGNAIAVDASGDAFVTGRTASQNFPRKIGAQPLNRGKDNFSSDAFVTKFNLLGTDIVYSAYVGARYNDAGYGIAVDSEGNPYITGETESTGINQPVGDTFPTTAGSVQPNSVDVLCCDAFVVKIKLENNALVPVYSTFLGGKGWDRGTAIAVDKAGNAYVTGYTFALDFFPSGAVQGRNAGGHDAFVTKLNPAGSGYIYSTYLGGGGSDEGNSIACDDEGNAYVIGDTFSTNFPVVNAAQEKLGGIRDVFVTKINSSGTRLAFSTYFGGNSAELGTGITVSPIGGDIFLAGRTLSDNFPLSHPFQNTLVRANPDVEFLEERDAFVTRLAIPTSSVSGRVITSSGRPLTNVQLNASGDTLNKAFTAANGDYLIELIQGNNHTFAPSFSTHRFTPPAYSFNPLAADRSGIDFTATLINDNFSDAVLLTGESGTVFGNNDDATRQSGEPNHAQQPGNKSVWYRIRPTANGQASFSTYGSSFDTTLAVYTGPAANNLAEVAKSDDAAAFDKTSQVSFGAVAGTDYWIAVDGKQPGLSGNFKLNYFTTSVTVSGLIRKNRVPQSDGLIVKVTSTDNGTLAYTTTKADGSYSITIPAGSYNFAVLSQQNAQLGQAVTLLDISADRVLDIDIDPPASGEFTAQGPIVLPRNAVTEGLDARAEYHVNQSLFSIPCVLLNNATQFSCNGLVKGTSYSVKVTSPNYNFRPNEYPLNEVQSNVLDLKFEATHNLSGVVTDGAAHVPDVVITVAGNTPDHLSITTKTNASGNFLVSLPTGYNYTVMPSLTGLEFDPSSRSFVNLDNHMGADFSVLRNCTYAVSPGPALTIPASGGASFSLNITTTSNCSWTAAASEPWVKISSGAGTGSKSVTFSVLENPATQTRPATITIAGKVVTINQEAATLGGAPKRARFDFDGDGRADIVVNRPANNIWYLLRTSAGYTAIEFGIPGDALAPADYDGDGKTDVAVFRPSSGTWFVQGSQVGFYQDNWGQAGDLPVPGDFDGDKKADLAVFRPSNRTWYVRTAAGAIINTQFGEAGDQPQVGDFDGDGRTDLAVVRPSNNTWYFLRTTTGYTAFSWGATGDINVPADYDGDGKTDVAVFRPSTGQWFIVGTSAGVSVPTWGQTSDVPVPDDYDGDGKADLAIFRPSDKTWYLSTGSGQARYQFGEFGDAPVPNAFVR